MKLSLFPSSAILLSLLLLVGKEGKGGKRDWTRESNSVVESYRRELFTFKLSMIVNCRDLGTLLSDRSILVIAGKNERGEEKRILI